MKKLLFILFIFININSWAQYTEVGGIISENTIWTKENSPYLVIENIFVEDNIILEIEPGVEIFVSNSKFFYIKGEIHAIGTINDSIIIKGESNSITYSWQGFSFEESSTKFDSELNYLSGNKFEYCKLSNAENLINLDTASSSYFNYCELFACENGIYGNLKDTLVIKNTNITNVKYFFYNLIQYSSSKILIDNCLFFTNEITEYCKYYELRIKNLRNILIENSKFENYRIYSLPNYNDISIKNNYFVNSYIYMFHSESNSSHDISIESNTFYNSYISFNDINGNVLNNIFIKCDKGIEFGESSGYKYHGTIKNNIFIKNACGIYGNLSGRAEIYNNQFISNGYGLYIDKYNGVYTIANTYIKNNTFINNSYYGISIEEFDSTNISNNNFINSNIEYRGEADIEIDSNFWYSSLGQSVDDMIFDFYDNFNYGKVNYINNLSQLIDSITIVPPLKVKAIKNNENYILSWEKSLNETIEGYKLYIVNNDSLIENINVENDLSYTYSGELCDSCYFAVSTYKEYIEDNVDYTQLNESYPIDALFSRIFVNKDIFCHNDEDGEIKIKVFGGIYPYEYLWENDTNLIIRSELSAGFYSIQITDALGTQVCDTIELINPDSVYIYSNFSDTIVTKGDSVALILSSNYQDVTYFFEYGNIIDDTTYIVVNEGEMKNAYAINSFSCRSENITINFLVDNSNIEDIHKLRINIYPNPVNNQVNIELSDEWQPEKVQLYNIMGRLLKSINVNKFKNITMNFSDIPKGIYILKLLDKEKFISYRIIKQ
ncbi:MAG: T9SS type A sorting domain-containing protein [Bacteroidetes bacterium]|nr:T9SS type A sorting domain-containing protein [Bacteroidota bacterium]